MDPIQTLGSTSLINISVIGTAEVLHTSGSEGAAPVAAALVVVLVTEDSCAYTSAELEHGR